MKELEDIRSCIDRLDEELSYVFEKRMDYVKKILEIKKIYDIQILDVGREEYCIQRFCNFAKQEQDKKYYKAFYTNLLNISKQYQYEQSKGEFISEFNYGFQSIKKLNLSHELSNMLANQIIPIRIIESKQRYFISFTKIK